MKRFRTLGIFAACAVAIVGGAALLIGAPNAATPNFPITQSGVQVVTLQLSGQYTTTTAAVARLALPFPAHLVGVSASARASGGTSPTLTVDLLDDSVSVLSAPIAVTAGAVAEGTIATARVLDESIVTIDLAIGGTSPTWNDITVAVTIVRLSG